METTNHTPDLPETEEKHLKIKTLNDTFRKTFIGGIFLCTQGIEALGNAAKQEIAQKVQEFDTFTPDNDPYGEHDFGSFAHDGHKIFWKIDYYDKSMTFASEDASNPDITTRILTIMLAQEY